MIIYWSCNRVLHYIILEIVDTYFVRACYTTSVLKMSINQEISFSVNSFCWENARTNHLDNTKGSFLLEQPFPIKKIIVTKQLNIYI